MPSLEQLSPWLLHAATETGAERLCEAGGSECASWMSRERCDGPSIGMAGPVADKAALPNNSAAIVAHLTMSTSRGDIDLTGSPDAGGCTQRSNPAGAATRTH
jgi:hypothetical protein